MNAKIGPRDIKLHWGLGELTSERWRGEYITRAPPALVPTIQRLHRTLPGRTVASLSEAEQNDVVRIVEWFRAPLFGRYVDRAANYEIRDTAVADLMATVIMPEMWGGVGSNHAVLLGEYARSEPPAGSSPTEPRVLARRWITSAAVPDGPFGYPVIGYDFRQRRPVLIDGFTRCAGLVLRSDMGHATPTVLPVVYCDP